MSITESSTAQRNTWYIRDPHRMTIEYPTSSRWPSRCGSDAIHLHIRIYRQAKRDHDTLTMLHDHRDGGEGGYPLTESQIAQILGLSHEYHPESGHALDSLSEHRTNTSFSSSADSIPSPYSCCKMLRYSARTGSRSRKSRSSSSLHLCRFARRPVSLAHTHCVYADNSPNERDSRVQRCALASVFQVSRRGRSA